MSAFLIQGQVFCFWNAVQKAVSSVNARRTVVCLVAFKIMCVGVFLVFLEAVLMVQGWKQGRKQKGLD